MTKHAKFSTDGDDKMADLCLRAVRCGARSGLVDAVSVGSRRGRLDADDQARSEAFWHSRNPGVSPTGDSHHWNPLPGIQVVMTAHNASLWIMGCIGSIERSLAGFRWRLIITDDGSTDNTADLCEGHISGADSYTFQRHKKAANVDTAKNRAVRLALEHQQDYPVVCLMDADDEMRSSRVRHLLWQMRDGGHLAVFGDYQRYDVTGPEHVINIIGATEVSQVASDFGPWATLFHASLIPEDGNLFWDNPFALGDCDLWLRWHIQGVKMVPLPGEVVHIYYVHPQLSATRRIHKRSGLGKRHAWIKRKMQLVSLSSEP